MVEMVWNLWVFGITWGRINGKWKILFTEEKKKKKVTSVMGIRKMHCGAIGLFFFGIYPQYDYRIYFFLSRNDELYRIFATQLLTRSGPLRPMEDLPAVNFRFIWD